mmetsp:Transcript_9090/g.35562  ORF Transcript_9090/g.35562 Transcript_9090/m.35562 type:complete len:298 (+) Transcript_9090:1058-1951(+)
MTWSRLKFMALRYWGGMWKCASAESPMPITPMGALGPEQKSSSYDAPVCGSVPLMPLQLWSTSGPSPAATVRRPGCTVARVSSQSRPRQLVPRSWVVSRGMSPAAKVSPSPSASGRWLSKRVWMSQVRFPRLSQGRVTLASPEKASTAAVRESRAMARLMPKNMPGPAASISSRCVASQATVRSRSGMGSVAPARAAEARKAFISVRCSAPAGSMSAALSGLGAVSSRLPSVGKSGELTGHFAPHSSQVPSHSLISSQNASGDLSHGQVLGGVPLPASWPTRPIRALQPAQVAPPLA